MNESIYYTFIYCFAHDDGYIIRSNKEFILNEEFKCCESSKICDFNIMGILEDDSITIKEIYTVVLDYTKYCGGFEFKFYMQNIIDENMNYLNIPIDEFPDLKKWFDQKFKK